MMLTVTTAIVALLVCGLADASLLLGVAAIMVGHHAVGGMYGVHVIYALCHVAMSHIAA